MRYMTLDDPRASEIEPTEMLLLVLVAQQGQENPIQRQEQNGL